jgi:hypothetical protein
MSMFDRVQRDDAWVLEMSEAEQGQSIQVGGLHGRLSALTPDASRRSLAQFVELSRRQFGLSAKQFAQKAGLNLMDLLAIEMGAGPLGNPQAIIQIALFLKVEPAPLLVLAGLSGSLDSELGNVAIQFTARLEPVAPLEPREEEALNWFKSEAFKLRNE